MSLSQLSEGFKAVLKYAADELKGSARRIFMAKTVKELGPGGQTRAERELGWNRSTLRKGYPLKKWGDLNLAKVSAHYAANSD